MLLAIDTSAGTSVAVVDRDGGVLAERTEFDTRRHAEVIGTLIVECLADAAVDPSRLSAIVSGMGPGPFTGLRVGIAAARAFAFGAGKPCLPLVSHDAVAFERLGGLERSLAGRSGGAQHDSAGHDSAGQDSAGQDSAGQDSAGQDSAGHDSARHDSTEHDASEHAAAQHDSTRHEGGPGGNTRRAPLLVVTDARRREVYWGAYSGIDDAGLPVRVGEPGLTKPGDLDDAVVASCGPDFARAAERTDPTDTVVSAAALGMLAETLFAAGRPFAADLPLYLRSPDVTLPGAPKRVS